MKIINLSFYPRRLTAMAGSFAAVVSIGTALLLLVGIHSSQAGEIKIVSPSAYKDIEGEDGGGGGTSPFRFQQVFPAADFGALGNKPHWLVGYTFRPDQSLTSPRTVQFPDNEVRLSTTQRGPDDLSEVFDNNLGPDVMQFYRGLVIMAADIDGASPVPRDFYNSEFPAGVTPYLYDPSQGNLLFDAIGWQGISPSTFNDRVPGIQTTLLASSPSATHGEPISAVMFQFTFIPVPEPRAVVSPSAYKDREGEDSVGDNCCSPYRYQQVFPAADFAALGNQPHWLVGYTWRPDESVTSPRTVQFPDNEVRLSTTQRGPDNLSEVFDDNLGPDVMQFYRGPLTAVADGTGPGPGPREFYNADYPAGVTPFLYDPSQGNLLFDVIAWQGESPSGNADRVTGMQTALYGSSPFATDGERMPAAVFQFTFIPVPEPRAVSIDLIPTGVRLRFAGVPGRSYNIERAPDLAAPWSTINTQTAPASGFFEFLDTLPHPGSGFYRLLQLAAWGPAVSIDPGGLNNVNTDAMEGCPIESPDGRALYFASNRPGGQGGIDIWMARREGTSEPWRDPVNLPSPVNSASDDFCPTPLVDGELFFVSRRPGGCGENSADIYHTRLDPNTGWLNPVHLGCAVNSAGDEFAPSYVPSGGGMLFFSSNRDGTHKIYASARQPDGSFGVPVEVTELNAPGFNTLRPNVSEDGREIGFDSDRPGGLGGPDIWSASRSSVAHAWSAPVNLGPNVNSVSAETRPSLSGDGRRLTFGSPRPGGQGSSDIYVSTR